MEFIFSSILFICILLNLLERKKRKKRIFLRIIQLQTANKNSKQRKDFSFLNIFTSIYEKTTFFRAKTT